MTEHRTHSINSESLRENLEAQFVTLYVNEQYNGKYAEEFIFLENILADEITEGSDECLMEETTAMQSCNSVLIAGKEVLVGGRGISSGCLWFHRIESARCREKRASTMFPVRNENARPKKSVAD